MRGSSTQSVIARANAVSLTPALLKRVTRTIAALPAEQQTDFALRGLAMIQVLEDARPDLSAPRDQAALLTALDFRMEALRRLRESSAYRAWRGKAWRPDEPDFLHDVLLNTAASEPLIDRDGHAAFEPNRFFRTVLGRCKTKGTA